ncbi:MAG TPA: hypothetical protein VG389_28670 [Myxococcota bacterium]|nr:hypothetical protein [Myxococcota bacterium]
MYRDEHEAALRRADALQREVEELRARAETHDGTARRLDALERDITGARAHLYADARRLADMERRLRELRGDTAPPTRRIVAPPPLRRANAGHLIAAAAVTATFVSAAAGFMSLTRGHLVVAPPDVVLAPDEGPPDAAEAGEALADPADTSSLDVAYGDDGFAGRPRHERALADYEKGLRLLHKGHVAPAREAFEAAIGVYPVLPGPHRELARLLALDDNADDACAEFATYLSLDRPSDDADAVKAEARRLGEGSSCDVLSGTMVSNAVSEPQVP